MNTELILSIVVASATTIYTIITIFQLKESRKVRLQKETPNIIPYLKSSENHVVMELYIENFGEGVAKDVKEDFVKDFNIQEAINNSVTENGYELSRIEMDIITRKNSKFVDASELVNPNKLEL